MHLNECIDSPISVMENVFESNASMVFDKLEKQSPISWTKSDVNQEDYRNSWCQYRNAAQENKENIEPTVNDEQFCEEEKDEGGQASVDAPMEIVMSLSACSIAVADASSQQNDSVLDPPPVKRARIVKPPEAYQSDKKSTPKAQPFSFLARERENRERRDARRSYYELLTKKTSPQPFKARPMPNFKPVPQTPPKFVSKSASPQAQTPKATTSAKTPVLQPILTPRISRPTGSLVPPPRPTPNAKSNVLQPIRTSRPSEPAGSLSQTPRESRISRIQTTNKTPGALPCQGLNKTTGNCAQTKTPLKRAFNASNTPNVHTSTTVVQSPKSTEESPRRRTITIPKSPQLSTAIRARERRQFEEMMQEKLRQREVVRRMEIATIRCYEQQEVAQLRKSMIHKPVPVPNSKNVSVIKRPSTHSMLPVFVKRPRWV